MAKTAYQKHWYTDIFLYAVQENWLLMVRWRESPNNCIRQDIFCLNNRGGKMLILSAVVDDALCSGKAQFISE